MRLSTAVLATVLASGCGDSPTANPIVADLDRLALATERYRDVAVALADGFRPDPVCVSEPGGAMGFHYVNPSRVDERIVLEEPEILLYIPEDGQLRLVGVEYFKPVHQGGRPYVGATAPADPGPAPSLMGQTFQGPMAGHSPTMPWHYDLHVWVWRHNPAGHFATANPELRCP